MGDFIFNKTPTYSMSLICESFKFKMVLGDSWIGLMHVVFYFLVYLGNFQLQMRLITA